MREGSKPVKPRPTTKGERIARIMGALSGMRDQLHMLKQGALNNIGRCRVIQDENEVIDMLTASQKETILKIQQQMTSAFDGLDISEKTLLEIESRIRGET